MTARLRTIAVSIVQAIMLAPITWVAGTLYPAALTTGIQGGYESALLLLLATLLLLPLLALWFCVFAAQDFLQRHRALCLGLLLALAAGCVICLIAIFVASQNLATWGPMVDERVNIQEMLVGLVAPLLVGLFQIWRLSGALIRR
jgi:hypothetical protein